MSRWLALALVLASCSKHAAPPTAQGSAVMPDDLEAQARDFIAKTTRREYAAAVAMFDDRMRAALPAAKLAALWTDLETKYGKFVRIDAVEVSGHTAAAKATFEQAPLVLRIAFGADRRIAGFHFADDWKPPSYAQVDSFDERTVTVAGLPGTLSMPKGASHVPAVVLVHGSGPNDRDETLGGLKVFKDLAYGLASRGIAVLRYDKRSRVNPIGIRTQTQEVDEAAHAAIAFVRALPEVDPDRIALLGHSQGGYLAPRIAKADPAIKRVVIFAGPTRPLEVSMLSQLRYIESLSPTAPGIHDAVTQAEHFKAAVEDPALGSDTPVAVPLGSSIMGAYFLEVRDYHPAQVAAELHVPVLVLQGEGDYQVTLADDFPAWKVALEHVPTATLRTYPHLSHAFTPAGSPPSPADYTHPGHVDPQVIEDVAKFLLAK